MQIKIQSDKNRIRLAFHDQGLDYLAISFTVGDEVVRPDAQSFVQDMGVTFGKDLFGVVQWVAGRRRRRPLDLIFQIEI